MLDGPSIVAYKYVLRAEKLIEIVDGPIVPRTNVTRGKRLFDAWDRL